MSSKRKIAVVGAGWYGCHLASELIRMGEDVTIFEQSDKVFNGSSGFNQFRLHLGFHYPRSSKTRAQVVESYRRFVDRYPHLIYPVTKNVYGIANVESMVDYNTYRIIMEHDCPVPFEELDPAAFGLTNLEGALLCQEGALLAKEPQRFFEALLRDYIMYNSRINSVRSVVNESDEPTGVEVNGQFFDWCLDCTYGQLMGFAGTAIYYEPCLTLIYHRKDKNVRHLSEAITVMDGQFVSLFPYFEDYADARGDLRRLHTLTHVKYTHLAKFDNFQDAKQFVANFTAQDAEALRPKFEAEIMKYLPNFKERFDYQSYFLSYKTKTPSSADARETMCEVNGRVLSVMSGKVNTIFEAEDFVMSVLGYK